MRSGGNTRASLMAALAIATMGAGHEPAEPAPLRRTNGSRPPRPAPPSYSTDLAREIAEHNAEVDRRKVERKSRKAARS